MDERTPTHRIEANQCLQYSHAYNLRYVYIEEKSEKWIENKKAIRCKQIVIWKHLRLVVNFMHF